MPRFTDFGKWLSIPGICALLFLIFYATTLAVSLTLILPVEAQAPPTPAEIDAQNLAKQLAQADKQLAEANSRAAALDARMSNVQTMLTVLTAVGTLLGLVVGGTTYFNLKRIQQDATDDLEQIRADFPAIASLNHKIKRLLEGMAARPQLRLEHLDPETYKSFEPDAREDLLIREISFNALTIFDYEKVPALTRSTAEAHVTFGHFYGAWYIDDAAKNRFAFERAILYLNKALESGEESVMTRVKTALGVLYTWRSTGEGAAIAEDLRDKALTNFDAVLKENPIDPRCLLGAAWVDHRENATDRAIKRLTKLIDSKPTQPEEGRKRLVERARLNRACYYIAQTKFSSAMGDLRDSRAAAIADNTFLSWKKLVNEEGDFKKLPPAEAQELADMTKP
jgi:hypothetical protein